MRTTPAVALASLAIIGLSAGCGADDEPGRTARTEPRAAEQVSFTAVESGDVGEVCQGQAMSNAAALDRGAPVGLAFATWYDDERRDVNALFLERTWVLPFDDFEDTSVVACATASESLDAAAAVPCDVSDVTFAVAPSSWTVELREAATGEVLATAPEPVPGTAPECPEVAPLHVADVMPSDPDAVAIGDAADALVAGL